jgi:hypothetical protein
MSEKLFVDSASLVMATPAERRAAMQKLEEERMLARRRALESQTAADTLPHERIRIWEQLHALRLPLSTTHPLLAVVAAQTKLTLHDIREEQRRRMLGAAAGHLEGT